MIVSFEHSFEMHLFGGGGTGKCISCNDRCDLRPWTGRRAFRS
jgi:hypothetical protein